MKRLFLLLVMGLSFGLIASAYPLDAQDNTAATGSQILFMRGDRQQPNQPTGIYTLDENTGLTTLLIGGKGFYFNPAWSPDGKQVLFNHIDDRSVNMYTIDVAGGRLTQLTDGTDYEEPSWSPDGSLIAYSQGDGPAPQQNLYVMRLADKSNSRLTNSTNQMMEPRWSPDGTKLAFIKGGNGYEIYLLDLITNQETQLTNGYANAWLGISPWSPDGKKLVFSSFRDVTDFKIYVLDMDTMNVQMLAEPDGIKGEGASWSPDGERIGFCHKGDDSIYHIFTVNADGQNLRQITNDVLPDCYPSWQP